MSNRIKKLQKGLKSPLIITNPQDLFYLTGHFLFDGGFLLMTSKQVVLFGGHLEKIKSVKIDSLNNIGKYIGRAKNLDLDDHATLLQHKWLKKFLPKVKINPVDSPAKELRLYKDTVELEAMTEAYKITAKVFAEVKRVLKKQKWTEQQLAEFIRLAGISFGADDVSFPTIVASGRNAAVPHHVPTEKLLKAGESIVLDFGFKVDGYCSDFTRTVFIKNVPPKLLKMYEATEAAYKLSVAAVKNNIVASEVDLTARNYLAQHGWDEYFIHSLGHGTGLNVHEAPHIHSHSEELLKNNMVFSIEPGVYIEKLGGIRIEDLVYLKEGKANYFAKVSTKLEDMII
jgi:Xaa-Pro aminopeptidase